MNTLYLILYIAAAVCFAVAAVVPVPPRVSVLAVGLLLWVLVPLIETARIV